MLLMLAAAMGFAWLAERDHLRDVQAAMKAVEQKLAESELREVAAKQEIKKANESTLMIAVEASWAQERSKELQEQMSQIEKQLPALGVDLWLQGDTSHSGPVVKRRYPAH
jgi:septal ring factor EnvC (AmiA/AmiB activator)